MSMSVLGVLMDRRKEIDNSVFGIFFKEGEREVERS